MKRAKDFRSQAWQSMHGKWGTLAIIYLVYYVITGCIGAISAIPAFGSAIGSIISIIISGPFALGLTIVSLYVVRGVKISVNDMFEGFKQFLNAFLANLINGIFIVLWTLLLIVPGIIKAYSYSMTYYILSDNPVLTANEARKQSMELMRGNKWRLFCLNFSFIGWIILCVITLGILSFWISPYIQSSVAAFYEEISGSKIIAPEDYSQLSDMPTT